MGNSKSGQMKIKSGSDQRVLWVLWEPNLYPRKLRKVVQTRNKPGTQPGGTVRKTLWNCGLSNAGVQAALPVRKVITNAYTVSPFFSSTRTATPYRVQREVKTKHILLASKSFDILCLLFSSSLKSKHVNALNKRIPWYYMISMLAKSHCKTSLYRGIKATIRIVSNGVFIHLCVRAVASGRCHILS